jgi:spermidine/putrescine-binding protein
MSKNKISRTFTLLMIGVFFVACKKDTQNNISGATEKTDPLAMETELNILALDGRIESGNNSAALDWVRPFEAATGCSVNARLEENNEQLMSQLAGRQYDLVIAADAFLPSDQIQEIEFTRLRSFKNLDKRFALYPSLQNKLALPLHWKLIKLPMPSTDTVTELESIHLLSKAKNPNCAYAWMEWSLSPKVQADIAAALDTIPVIPAACVGNELLGDDACEQRMANNIK